MYTSSTKLSDYNKITLKGTSQEKTAFNDMLSQSDIDVKQALDIIDLYGLEISFADLNAGEEGKAEVGGDEITLDKDLLSDPSRLKDVFAHELAHILGASHDGTAEQEAEFDALEEALTNGVDDDLTDVFAHYETLDHDSDEQKEEYSKAGEAGGSSTNQGVTVSEMTTSSDGKASFSGVKEGDQMVVIMSISGDIPSELNGFEVAYDGGASNGKTEMKSGEKDLRTVVLTKTATAEDAQKGSISYDFGKKVSTQAFSVSGGKIDIGTVAEHAADSKGQTTAIDANNKKDAAFYLNVASCDDPADYQQNAIQGDDGIVTFAGSISGDDSGASWITTDNDGGSIAYDKVNGGDNDQGLSIAIVAN